jgi:Zn finger protein HypA/HybF involved in hydrogenase expression
MTLEGLVVNRYPTRRTVMAVGVLKNWVWCEDCLEWKDAGDEVSFDSIAEDTFGKDVMTFICDKCENTNKGIIVESVTRPRGQ